MKELERFKESILREYPRLSRQSSFKFKCHADVPCFNDCCADVNIFLTPYDVLRLRKTLGLGSAEFLREHTLFPFDKNLKYPVLMLKMRDDDKKACPFVTAEGCSVYEDRPWACRMYPLGLATPKEEARALDETFYFLLSEGICKGHAEAHEQTVAEWIEDQGVQEYDDMGQPYKELTLHRFFQEGKELSPQQLEMFFKACYDLDAFRVFLFESTFFEKFEVDDATKAALESDDLALLKFGFAWLRFALFGEPTMTVKSEVMEAKKRDMAKEIKS